MKKILSILFLMGIFFLNAETEIPEGNIYGSWAMEGSPYIIMGNITIPENETLNIEAGCEIIFQDHFNISCNGSIFALGSVSDSIRFTATNPDIGWRGIDMFYPEEATDISSSVFQHCSFENAVGSGGYWDKKGAVFCLKNGNQLILQNCIFENNIADYGGAIYAYKTDIQIDNCSFKDNTASHDAGAVYVGAETIANISNSFFQGNIANYDGGAIYAVGLSNSYIVNCDFSENATTDQYDASGGAISVWGSTAIIEECCIHDNNSFNNSGGIEVAYQADVTIINCDIIGNFAYQGGGVTIYDASLEIIGGTIAYNMSNRGGGLYASYQSEITFDQENRCSIYLNSASSIYVGANDIHVNGSTNIEVYVDTFTVINPSEEFIYPPENIIMDINTGYLIQTDQDIFVSPDGDNSNNGLSSSEPLRSISTATIMAVPGDTEQTIHLAAGTYSISSTSETFPLVMKTNLTISGAGLVETIIDAENRSQLVSIIDINQFTLRDLTLQNGIGNYYGAIYCFDSSGLFEDLLIRDCKSVWQTGGFYFDDCSEINLIDVEIEGNEGANSGGLSSFSSTINMAGCSIHHNSAIGDVGGFYATNSTLNFSSENLNSIYYNYCSNGQGTMDIRCNTGTMNVIVDTFTVMKPTEYFASPINNFTFDIQNSFIQQIEGDVYVSADGSNQNSGSSENDPLISITLAIMMLDTSNTPGTVHLAAGNYSPSSTGDSFPINIPSNVTVSGNSADTTIIDGEESGTIFGLYHPETALKNMTLKNSTTTCVNLYYSEFHLQNLVIKDCICEDYLPAGINGSLCNGIIEDCDIYDNYSMKETAGARFYSSTITFIGGSIRNNITEHEGTAGLIAHNSTINFDQENRISIYNNRAIKTAYYMDMFLYQDIAASVYLDTFTVNNPDQLFCYPLEFSVFEVLHPIIEQPESDLFVSPSGSDDNSGISPDTPLKTVTMASKKIQAEASRTIHLAAGTYSSLDPNEQFPILLKNDVTISGAGISSTIIDGAWENRIFYAQSVEDTSINNLTCKRGSDICDSNSIRGGGGILLRYSNVDFENVMFFQNKAIKGSAIGMLSSNSNYEGCVFYKNFYRLFHEYELSTFHVNSDSQIKFINCTIYDNNNYNIRTMLLFRSDAYLVNTIFANDVEYEIYACALYLSKELVITHSSIAGGTSGIYTDALLTLYWEEGNQDNDPLFLPDSWYLSDISTCIDAGTAYYNWNDEVLLDMQEDEYYGSAPDIGAYEYGMTVIEDMELIPIVYSLKQNYPNPFNPETTISYNLPEDCNVKLEIYNIKGQKIRTLVNDFQEAGKQNIVWKGEDDNNFQTASGIYFYKIKAGNYEKCRKMILMK